MEGPVWSLCQVKPCDDALNHLIHETCESTVTDKNLPVFHNDVSDQYDMYVMILEGDKLTFSKYTTSGCSGTSDVQTLTMGPCTNYPSSNVVYGSSAFTYSSGGTSPVTSPVTSLTKSPTGSPVASATTSLTGYVTFVFYQGSSCSDQAYATTEILNSCYRFDDTTYRLVTATSSSVVETSYTDSKCTMGASVESYSYTDGVCFTSGKVKAYVSSSSVWNSDSVTATIR